MSEQSARVINENLIAALTNSTVGNYSYTYDANDNKTAETISGVMSGYGFTTPSGYDDKNRLVAWERDDAAQDLSWVLSDVGDWDSYTENTVTQNRTPGSVQALTAIDEWHRPLEVPPLPRSSVDPAEDWIGGEGSGVRGQKRAPLPAPSPRPSPPLGERVGVGTSIAGERENSAGRHRLYSPAQWATAIDAGPLTYDPKGNLTADEAGIAYEWDADNMLSEADVPANPTE